MVGLSAAKAFGRAIGDETIRISVIVDRLKDTVERGAAATQSASAPPATSSGPRSPDQTVFEVTDFYSSLQKVLLDTRPYSATDSRDKIFGVLGIAQKALPSDMAMPLTPDYSSGSTAQDVFTSVATFLLEKLPKLSNLSHVEDKGSVGHHQILRHQFLLEALREYQATILGYMSRYWRSTLEDYDCKLTQF